jgi:hypothetical protein
MPELSFKQQLKRHPDVADARRDVVDVYRKVRANNPAIARLLYRRMKEAEEKTIASLFTGSETEGGLSELLNDDK